MLINNAGAFFSHRRVSEDGLELTFALNHMAYFVLTCALADRLKPAAPSRVVSTASGAHRSAHLDFDDLQSSRGYDGYKAYGRSKLCNILFTRALARRLPEPASPPIASTPASSPPASAIRRRLDVARHPRRQALRHLPGQGRRDHRLSRRLPEVAATRVSISTKARRTRRRPKRRTMLPPTGSGRIGRIAGS